jgi:hypothetical protein
VSEVSVADIASLATVVSSIAVAETLVLLLLQLQHNNRNQRALIQQGRSARQVEMLYAISQPHVQMSFVKGYAGDTLTAGDHWTFINFVYAMLINLEDSFLQHRAGTIDPSSWESDVV